MKIMEGIVLKNLDFILKSVIIYITLGVAYCSTVEIFSKYTHYSHTIVFIGGWVIMERLLIYDKQKNIKLFKHINIVWIHFFITGITIFVVDLLHLV